MKKVTLLILILFLACQKNQKANQETPSQKSTYPSKQVASTTIPQDNSTKDTVIADWDGNQLKLVYQKINNSNAVAITFKGKTVLLYQTKSASGVRFADKHEQYVWFEKGDNILFLKDEEVLFSSPEQFLKFSEAKNYFIKKEYPNKEVHPLKIISATQFNTLFGAATTMGKEGMPTKIDFSKYYVVAIIGKTNTKGNEIDVRSVILLRNTITVTVFVTPKEEGKTQSYSSRPVKLLIIANKYQGKIKMESY